MGTEEGENLSCINSGGENPKVAPTYSGEVKQKWKKTKGMYCKAVITQRVAYRRKTGRKKKKKKKSMIFPFHKLCYDS